MNIVGVCAKTFSAERLDDNLPLFDGFQYFFITQNHNLPGFKSYRFVEKGRKTLLMVFKSAKIPSFVSDLYFYDGN
jgi:hypothetical protein